MNHLIKSTTALTATNVITKVTSMLFFILLARSMSVSDYGLFRYLITLSAMYGILFTGIPTALTKYLSHERKLLKEYLSNTVFMMAIAFVVLSAVALFSEYRIFLILFIFAVLIDSLYLGFVRGLLNYVKLAGFKLGENIIQLVILVISYFIFKELNFTFAVIFYSFSGLLSLIIFEIWKPELKFTRKLSKEKIKQLLKYTIPVTLGSIGWTIMFGINSIFIEAFSNTEQVGYYSVGMTLVQAFTFLPAAIATIIMPKVSSLKDKNRLLKPLTLAVLGTIAISAVGLVALLLLITPIINILFTDVYLPSAIIILPLSLSQIFISIHQIFASVFQGLDKPGVPSTTISIAAAFNVLGSYLLTKNYGILGASISSAVTSFLALILISIWFKIKWKTISKAKA
ncbi:flippase [Candidatus Woesearchaeota archaeon]|nr:flippase [Candidatus Woesearchaeota archaeon]